MYYVESAVKMGWTRNLLLNFIKAEAYKNAKLLPKINSFKRTLPENLQEQASEILKSSYSLDFLGLTKPLKELDLEKRIVEKIKLFLLELGEGFTFIGNQYRILSGTKEYFVDLLFFNRVLKSLVAIDLKIGENVFFYLYLYAHEFQHSRPLQFRQAELDWHTKYGKREV